jgi:iron-sulfur cluster assembly accessory protein
MTESLHVEKAAAAITATDKALAQIRLALSQQGISVKQGGLRLSVQGGGCAGLACTATVERQAREHDRVIMVSELRLFIDPKSFIFLFGARLDYREEPPAGFVIVSQYGTNGFCGCTTAAQKPL